MQQHLKGTILVVEDDALQRDIVKTILAKDGFYVEDAGTGKKALELVKNISFDCVLTDLRLPDIEGTEILKEVKSHNIPCHVVVMTAYGSIPSAIEATKLGAFHYLEKPLEKDHLLLVMNNAANQVKLLKDNLMLKDQLFDKFHLDNIIGDHGSMKALFGIVRKVAPTDSTVLIYGESGTGKEALRQEHPLQQPEEEPPVLCHKLRLYSRDAPRKRAVRLRERRIYRRTHQAFGSFRAGERKHPFLRRDRGPHPGHAGEDIEGDPGERDKARRRQGDIDARRAHHLSHQQEA